MDIELLKKILMDNRRMIGRIEFIERDILLEEGLNYVFVGLHQAGKLPRRKATDSRKFHRACSSQ